MSPRTNRIYKKNLENVFSFNHETLNGLANMTEFAPDDPEDLKDPKHHYTSYAQLLKDVEIDRKLNYGTPIVFTGKIGDVEYKNKITTYGRIRLSKIINADIDDIAVDGEKVLGGPYERINAKSAAKLMSYLQTFDDCVEKSLEIQKFALKVVTAQGVVTFDYSTLYSDTNTETYREIRKIADSTELTDKQKLIAITEKFGKYEKEIEDGFSSDLKKELSRANRVKISSIIAMNMPQFIVSGVEEKPIVTKKNLLEGYSEEEYLYHAIENRSLSSIKQSGVKKQGSSGKTENSLLERLK